MASRSNRTSNLPSWFSAEKYDKAHSLTALGWYERLLLRQICMAYVERPADRFEYRIARSEREGVTAVLHLLREAPLIEMTTCAAAWPLIKTIMKYENHENRLAVHAMTILELDQIRQGLPKGHLEGLQQLEAEGYPTLKSERSINTWMRTPVSQDSSLPTSLGAVAVNLDYPNKVLVAQFKSWLKQVRDKSSGSHDKQFFRLPELAEWVEMGLLPCMDLLLWAVENEKKISNRLLADALSGSSGSDEDAVRKATRPLAESLLTWDERGKALLRRLRVEGNAEKIEREMRRQKMKIRKIRKIT